MTFARSIAGNEARASQPRASAGRQPARRRIEFRDEAIRKVEGVQSSAAPAGVMAFSPAGASLRDRVL
jgi:hypothetical protein